MDQVLFRLIIALLLWNNDTQRVLLGGVSLKRVNMEKQAFDFKEVMDLNLLQSHPQIYMLFYLGKVIQYKLCVYKIVNFQAI